MSTETIDEKPAAQVEHRWWLFTTCVLISLTNELSTAVTNLSLGPMRNDLGASSAVMQMVVTLGKLMLGAFMLAGGVAGDVYGRRRVLVLGALGMVGASLLAAVAQTGGMLLVARALDGLASAAIGPMALTLIASAFSRASASHRALSRVVRARSGARAARRGSVGCPEWREDKQRLGWFNAPKKGRYDSALGFNPGNRHPHDDAPSKGASSGVVITHILIVAISSLAIALV